MKIPVLTPRTWVSAVRTAVFGAVAGIFSITPFEAAEAVGALLVGALVADYTTWMIRALVTLPGNLANGIYQAALNIAFAWYLFDLEHIGVSHSPAAIGLAFMTYMSVLACKLLLYTMRFAQQEYGDD